MRNIFCPYSKYDRRLVNSSKYSYNVLIFIISIKKKKENFIKTNDYVWLLF